MFPRLASNLWSFLPMALECRDYRCGPWCLLSHCFLCLFSFLPLVPATGDLSRLSFRQLPTENPATSLATPLSLLLPPCPSAGCMPAVFCLPCKTFFPLIERSPCWLTIVFHETLPPLPIFCLCSCSLHWLLFLFLTI